MGTLLQYFSEETDLRINVCSRHDDYELFLAGFSLITSEKRYFKADSIQYVLFFFFL